MAGKSGREINNVPESPVKRMIFSWEGILVIVFILVNIFCAMFSEFYNLKNLLRQMPIYLAEVFLMLPMAYILVLGEIDISVGSIVCLSATMSCIVCNTGAPFIVVFLSALAVGTLCGAVNGFVLTRFQELPPMIVTLATQIIFRGIAEIVLGSGGSISATNTDGFRLIGGKIGSVPVPGSDSRCNCSSDPWKNNIRTSSLCNRNKPSCSILFRNSCTENPYADLYSNGNRCRPLCNLPCILFLRSKHYYR